MSNIKDIEIYLVQLCAWVKIAYGISCSIDKASDASALNITLSSTIDGEKNIAYHTAAISEFSLAATIDPIMYIKNVLMTACEAFIKEFESSIDAPSNKSGGAALWGAYQNMGIVGGHVTKSESKFPKSITEMYTMPPKVKSKAKSKLKLTAAELQTLAENKAAGVGIFATKTAEAAGNSLKFESGPPGIKFTGFGPQTEPPNSASELSNTDVEKPQLKLINKLSHKK